jgi:hypothetical protein
LKSVSSATASKLAPVFTPARPGRPAPPPPPRLDRDPQRLVGHEDRVGALGEAVERHGPFELRAHLEVRRVEALDEGEDLVDGGGDLRGVRDVRPHAAQELVELGLRQRRQHRDPRRERVERSRERRQQIADRRRVGDGGGREHRRDGIRQVVDLRGDRDGDIRQLRHPLHRVTQRREICEQALDRAERLGDELRRLVEVKRVEQVGEPEQPEELRQRVEQLAGVERPGLRAVDVADGAQRAREPGDLLGRIDETARTLGAAERHARKVRGRRRRRQRRAGEVRRRGVHDPQEQLGLVGGRAEAGVLERLVVVDVKRRALRRQQLRRRRDDLGGSQSRLQVPAHPGRALERRVETQRHDVGARVAGPLGRCERQLLAVGEDLRARVLSILLAVRRDLGVGARADDVRGVQEQQRHVQPRVAAVVIDRLDGEDHVRAGGGSDGDLRPEPARARGVDEVGGDERQEAHVRERQVVDGVAALGLGDDDVEALEEPRDRIDRGLDLALGLLDEHGLVTERVEEPDGDDLHELIATHRRDVVPGQDPGVLRVLERLVRQRVPCAVNVEPCAER